MRIVHIEDIKKHMKYKRYVNNAKIENLEWYRGGKQVHVTKSQIEAWKMTGMSNIDFARSHFLGDDL
jgi:hypothetical protein